MSSSKWTSINNTMKESRSRFPKVEFDVKGKLSSLVRRSGSGTKSTKSVLGDLLNGNGNGNSNSNGNLNEQKNAGQSTTRLQVKTDDFGGSGLDIDYRSLEAFRTADRWFEPQQQSQSKANKQQNRLSSSTTPIADMFAGKGPTSIGITDSNKTFSKTSMPIEPRHAPQKDGSQDEADRITETRAGGSAAVAFEPTRSSNRSRAPSIVERSRPVQPAESRLTSWPPPERPAESRTRSVSPKPIRISLATSVPASPPLVEKRNVTEPSRLSRWQMGNENASGTTKQVSGLNDDTADARKRHSIPPSMPALSNRPKPVPLSEIKNSLNARNSASQAAPPSGGSKLQNQRRQSWQPPPTSVPEGFAPPSPALSTFSNSYVSQVAAPPPARRGSTRLGANRLAWIKELEEGKNGGRRELPVLKKMQGGVADKLAKFENKKQQQQPNPSLPPLSRSNSNASRMSSYGSSSAYDKSVTTARTSIDSHRASSVMSNYDDSFREKMEVVAGSYKPQDGEEETNKPKRVTAAFVPVKPDKKVLEQETKEQQKSDLQDQPIGPADEPPANSAD